MPSVSRISFLLVTVLTHIYGVVDILPLGTLMWLKNSMTYHFNIQGGP